MGDRGNIAVQFDGKKTKRVWFYTHWSGSELDQTIAAALERGKSRWTDGSYLARIIFCELVKGNEMDTTGFGISLNAGDNEHAFRVVDLKSQTVFQEPDPDRSYAVPKPESELKPVPFMEFIVKHKEKLQPA